MSGETTINPEADVLADLADLRRRRLLNHSLLALALALPLAVAGWVGFRVAAHRFVADWLRAFHYGVDYEVEAGSWAFGGSTRVKAGDVRRFALGYPSNDALKHLGWLHRVGSLDLANASGYGDADLAIVGRLTDLESLNLDRSRQGWSSPETRKVTDATLVAIRPLVRLRDLNLGGQGITDEGLANLRSLASLRALDLRYTAVTDAGLASLKGLPRLESVDLSGTRVTLAGVAEFEAARPGVKVVADLPPAPTIHPTPAGPGTR